MQNLLLFGASGNLGQEIGKEAITQGYDVTAVFRNEQKVKKFASVFKKTIIADITNPESLKNICAGFEIVVSALGKSVSPNDHSKPSFNDIDYIANSNILRDAQSTGVKKFVYVSAFHAEKYLHLEYFRVHHAFSEMLKSSGINYAIIKPPAIFSGFLDMIAMAKKGQLVSIGKGEKTTNPISEGDLAKACVNAIQKDNFTQEIGGETIYTRKELLEIIQKEVAPSKSIKYMPLWLFNIFLPIIKVFNKNMFDKFAFFTAVIQVNTVAPKLGKMKFEEYVKLRK